MNKKFSKIIVFVLAMTLVCTCLTGCDLIDNYLRRTNGGMIVNLFGGSGGKTDPSGNGAVNTDHVKLEFEKAALELYVGDSERLSAAATPEVDGVSVEYSSSDEKVVSVSATGRATAKGAGTATITATYGTVSATCTITVIDLQITLDQTTLTLDAIDNSTAKLTATVSEPGMELTWESSDTKVAVVDQEGNVTAVGQGKATISAKVGNLRANCEVTVSVPEGYYTFTSANNASAFKNPGKFFYFTKGATVQNAYFYNGEAVLTVDNASGSEFFLRYQPVMEGFVDGDSFTATTTVTSSVAGLIRLGGADGKTQLIPIEANKPTELTFLNKQFKTDAPLSVSLCASETPKADDYATGVITLKATPFVVSRGVPIKTTKLQLVGLNQTYALLDAVKPGMTFESSDKSVATVDNNGNVKSVSYGECKITVTDGEMSAVCTVTVVDKVLTMTETNAVIELDKAATKQLTATVSDNSAITWTSSDDKVATVDSNGLVTALKTGVVTIRAAASDKTFAECTVIIRKSTDKITFTSGDGTTELPKAGSLGAWYKSKDFGKMTMKDGVLTIETTAQYQFDADQQIRYKPCAAGEQKEYLGTFYMIFTLTNNTDKDMTYTANINGQTTGSAKATLKQGETVTVVWDFTRTEAELDQQLNIKLRGYGIGTVTMTDIYMIPVSNG